ncbi:hypothetical protein [Hymenobacter sp. UYCo722]|uniref:hypothetical protein n=1 Tax=Hymenobacter sp. UYCo722 TaxID=3156335 RepID=UPI0033950442
MKNLLTACLPALALFALGGCAGTSALTSSEDDGVYYSSKDRTTAVVRAAPAPANASEEANPDYNGGAPSSSAAQRGSGATQYYDNSYSYMRGVPGYGSSGYYGSGLSGYSPYSPYTTLSYSPFGSVCTGFGYGWGGGACGYSPYAYGGGYDPFYGSPYGYSPYYGYGSGLSISFGFGRPYYGGYGYSPYGYGYGYSPYYYGGSYYGGYYGRGGYYGNSYGGGNYGNGNNGYYGGNNGDSRGNGRTYGHRTDRASEGNYSAAPATGTANTPTGGHVRSEQVLGNGGQSLEAASVGTSRGRRDEVAPPGGYSNQPQRLDDGGRPRYRNMDAPVATDINNGRTRVDGMQPQDQPATAPQDGRRRGGFFQNVFSEPAGNGNGGNGQAAEQPRQRSYEQARQRNYEQPRQQTYEQPQRSYSQPSYSAPSSGSGGGGGNSGGGGGGHRGRD